MNFYVRSWIVFTAFMLAWLSSQSSLLANPTGGIVVAGQVTISTNGTTTTIDQQSGRAVIDWRNFDIAGNETTQFIQPNSGSIALNRVTTGGASRIDGTLTANGNVLIINQNGVLFGKSAMVDVNGLVVTTADADNGQFMNGGQIVFDKAGLADATIVNEGTITAKDAGLVGLVAPGVSNSGVITARLGKVHLASGDTFTLDMYGDGLMNVAVSDNVSKQLIENKGVINAAGGRIAMTAASGRNTINSLINVTGELKAPSISQKNGVITISGAKVVSHTGKIDASGTTAGVAGGRVEITADKFLNQGAIDVSGKTGGVVDIAVSSRYIDSEKTRVKADGQNGDAGKISVIASAVDSSALVSGQYSASSTGGKGGDIDMTAKTMNLLGASLNASGDTGGGRIRLGGDYQGGNGLGHADTLKINFSTTLSADATDNGDGGTVIMWADKKLGFAGSATAMGGQNGGDGGLIEISAKEEQPAISSSAYVNASSPKGKAGSLLYDPKNIIISNSGSLSGLDAFQFVDPNDDGNGLYNSLLVLPNGNVVIGKNDDSLGGDHAGAIYLYNGNTGGLMSTLIGSSDNDAIGSNIYMLNNGNFVATSYTWNNTVGAVTWFNAEEGVNGVVDSSNSFTGSKAGDNVGMNGVIALSNDNFIVNSPNWNGNRGAVTWGNGKKGLTGEVDSSNSLVGTNSGDRVGSNGVIDLGNGYYIVNSGSWNGSRGAVTWADGASGITGEIDSSNSLVGSHANDRIGNSHNLKLANGNYVIASAAWNGNLGSVTWGDGSKGVTGVVSSSNSLVGSNANDRIGLVVNVLNNGNFVISSQFWNGNLGAATWVDGTKGLTGTVSSSNSLVGSSAGDYVGGYGITQLTNGNYVVKSQGWNGGRGAVTWASGTQATMGVVSSSNSLVGSSANDWVGSNVYTLSNGNYVVTSSNWNGNRGAATWGNGTTGISGVLSSTNSLVGSNVNDYVGSYGVTELANGNYVVKSPNWNGARGAVTWGSKTAGVAGVLSSSNSLVGTSASENVGYYVITLNNGNYVTVAQSWGGGKGAVTWGNGTTGVSGAISSSNSLVGSVAGDNIGYNFVTALSNGNYVVSSAKWNGNRGAVTWVDGTVGLSGAVSSSNSLVGSNAGDYVGNYGVTGLTNGNYVVNSANWNSNRGAVTWANGTTGITGAVSSSNSLVGSSANDWVGGSGVTRLNNGNYVVGSYNWNGGRGAATWVNGATGLTGAISSSNSLVGANAGDNVSAYGISTLSNNNYLVMNVNSNTGALGASLGNGTTGTTGTISTNNTIYGQYAQGFNSPNFEIVEQTGLNRVAIKLFDEDGTERSEVFSLPTSYLTANGYTFGHRQDSDVYLHPDFITATLNNGTAVTLQANNDITVSNAITANNPSGNGGALTLSAGRSILLNANITTDNGNLNLYGNSTAADGVIDAYRDAGNAVITMASGVSINAGTGAVNIQLKNGAGNSNTGAGAITLRDITAGTIFARNNNAAGDIVLASGTLAASAAGTATTLVAGRSFTNNAGSGALSTPAGRWLVYSTNPASDNTGSLSNNFRRYTCAYGGSCPTLGTGNGFLYSYTPTLTATASSLGITYGDAAPSLAGYAYSLSGYLGSDAAGDSVTGALTGTTNYTQFADVGNYRINYSSGTLASAMGYAVTYANNASAISVAAKTLTAGLTGAVVRTYDATTAAALTTGNYTLSGIVNGDSVALNNYTSGTFSDKNAGNAKAVSISGLTLTGAKAGNYQLASSSLSANIGKIAKKALTASLTGTVSKTYDQTTTATLASGNYNLSGVIAGDTAALNNPTSGTYNDKNVGTSKAVTVTGLSLSGIDAGNYSVSSSVSGNIGTILAKALTVTGVTAANKVYDQTTTATLNNGSAGLSGVISGDTVTVNTGSSSATFADKNVGTAKAVTAIGYGLSGTDASNYSITQPTGLTANITAKTLTASLTGTASKVYDQNTTATLTSGNYSLSGVIAGDTATLNNPTSGTYNDKNVGTSKAVSVTGLALSGTDAGNYSLSSSSVSGNIGTITAKTVTASLTGTVSKTYDRTNTATLASGNYNLSGVIAGDTATLNNPTSGTYNDKNVGTSKAVSVSGLALSGTDAANYQLGSASISGNIGTILAKALTVTGVTAANKVYDQNTTATLNNGSAGLSGVIVGDTVAVDSSGSSATFADKNVGTTKAVTAIGYGLSGTDASNYSITQPTSLTANITAKTLTASLTGTVSKTYDQTNTATLVSGNYNLSGVIAGDTATLNNPTSGTYNDKNVGTSKAVTVTGLSLSGTDAGNYSVSSSISGNIGTILAKALTITGVTAASKVYDQNTTATLNNGSAGLSGVISGDAVTVNTSGSSATFADKNVGTTKAVTAIGYGLSGTDASNYSVSQPTGLTANITAKTLTASLTGTVSKTYDQTNTATLASGNYNLSGVIAGDTATLNNPTSGTYNDKNVGTSKAVTVSGLALSGTDAGNYQLGSASISGNIGTILAKALTITGVTAADKVYDRTTTATLNNGSAGLSGVISGDAVTVNSAGSSATFADKNVGTTKAVTAIGYGLSGTDASNYSVSQPTGLTANITAKTLTASLTGTASKVYDQNTTATLASGNYSLAGVISGDDTALNNPTSGTYNDKNVGTSKAVTVSGLALSGTDAGNYQLGSATISGNIGTITAKSVTASLTGTASKVYDQNTTATLASGNYGLSGVIAGDTATLNNPTSGTYNDKNVGTSKAVSVTGLALSGTDAGNYSLSSSSISGNIGTITAKTLTASLTGTVSKTYDQTNTATLASGNYNLSGVIAGDTATLNNPTSGTYNDKNVGTSKAVTVSGLALSGTDAGNYQLGSASISGNIGTILAKALTITGVTAASKVYDQTTTATLNNGSAGLSGVISGDAVTVNTAGSSATFADKNVGTTKAVTAIGYALSGTDASNYSVSQPAGLTANITAKTLTASLTGTASKVYDQNTTATLASGNYNLSGVIAGDTATLNNPTSGTYNDKNAGTSKAVTVSGLALSGIDAGNYQLGSSTVSGNIGTITAKTLTASLTGTASKVYDQNTTATLASGNYNLSGVIAGDTATLNNPTSGTYNDKNVGTAKAVTVSGLALSGTDAGNYQLGSSTISGNIGTITAKTLTASLTGTVSKTYDRTDTATLASGNYNLSGVIAGDTATLNNPTSGIYNDKNVGTSKGVTVSGLVLSGTDAGNYQLGSNTISANIGTILAKALTVTGVTAADKVYDRTTTATLNNGTAGLSGVVAGDAVAVNTSGSSATFGDKNVGTTKAVTAIGYGLSGTDAGNYSITQPTGLSANITAKTLTASLTGTVSKTYDRDTTATLASGNYNLAGVISGDDTALNNPTSGTYNDKNVGTFKAVTVGSLALSGTDAGNYQLASSTISGNIGTILAKALTVTGVTAADRIYDRTTTATLNNGSAGLSGIISGDAVSVDASGSSATFGDKNVGTTKAVTAIGYGLSGTDASNYSITQPTGLTANIAAKTLIASLTGTVSKTYDQTNTATLASGNYNLAGVIAGDTATLNNPTSGTYNDKNVGTSKAVTVGGLALSGTDAGNYQLGATTISGNIGTILAKALTVTGVTAADKVYDRTTTATLNNGSAGLSGVISGDAVTVNTAGSSATFGDKNVGTSKAVTAIGYGLSGTDASNYSITQPTGLSANITAKTLTASLTGTVNKTYDNSTNAPLTGGNYNMTGAIAGDAVTLGTGTATFSDKNVGAGKTVTASGLSLQGTDAGNYQLGSATVSANIGTITAKGLVVTADNKFKMIGGVDPAFTYSYSGLASGDTSADFTGALERDLGGLPGYYGIKRGTLAAFGNYMIDTFNPGLMTIQAVYIPDTVTAGTQNPAVNQPVTNTSAPPAAPSSPVIASSSDSNESEYEWTLANRKLYRRINNREEELLSW